MSQVALVALFLLDLQAQCEAQLRAIAGAQRLIERYPDDPGSQLTIKTRLQADAVCIRATHHTIGASVNECALCIDRLTVEAA